MARIFSQKGTSLSHHFAERYVPFSSFRRKVRPFLIPSLSHPFLIALETRWRGFFRRKVRPFLIHARNQMARIFRRKVRPFSSYKKLTTVVADTGDFEAIIKKGTSLSHYSAGMQWKWPSGVKRPLAARTWRCAMSKSLAFYTFLIASLSHRVPFSSRPFLIASLSHRPFLTFCSKVRTFLTESKP